MKYFAIISLLITSTLSFGQTNVSGVLNNNSVWNLSGSPYYVTGSVLIPSGVTLTINSGVDVIFNGNYKILVQGRILALGGANDSIIFKPNNTVSSWGGIRFDNTLPLNDTSKFKYCALKSATSPGGTEIDGGGLYIKNYNKVKIHNSTFFNCKADNSYNHPTLGGKGGAIAIDHGACEIISSKFIGCNGNVQGGGIYLTYSIAQIIESIFINCKSTNSGGAISSNYSELSIKSSVFIKDSVTSPGFSMDGRGGALRIQSCTNCNIDSNVFSDCYVKGNGGALDLGTQNITINHNDFKSNFSTNNGGGLSIENGSPKFINNKIDSNYSAGSGGGVFINSLNSWGGDTLTFISCQIRYNSCQNEGGGIRSNDRIKLISTQFLSNNSNYGGGLFSYGDLFIYRSWFHGNSSNTDGGAIFVDKKLTISNCIFSNNIAGLNGGAISLHGSDVKDIYFTNIFNNGAKFGGGLYLAFSASPNIINSVLYENSTTTNPLNSNWYTSSLSAPSLSNSNQIHFVDQASQPNIYNSVIQGGINQISTNGNLFLGTFQSSLDTSPLFTSFPIIRGRFANANIYDFSPSISSPLINSGDKILSSTILWGSVGSQNGTGGSNHQFRSSSVDYYGNPRIIGCSPDIGAVEYTGHLSYPDTVTFNSLQALGSNCDTNRQVVINGLDSTLFHYYFRDQTLIDSGYSVSVDQSGIYKAISIDASSGCALETPPIYVNVTPKIQTASLANNATCHGDSTGQVNVSIYSSSIQSINWFNQAGQVIGLDTSLYNIPGGTYTLTIIDTNGCSNTMSFVITEPPQIQLSATPVPVSCHGGGDGKLFLAVSNAVPPYSINWLAPSSSNDTITGLSAGAYSATVTDVNGCTVSGQFTVSQPSVLSVQSSNLSHVSCFGGQNGAASVSVNGGNGGYVSTWRQPGSTAVLSTSTTLSGVSAGTYRYKVVDSKGCIDSLDVTITEPLAPLSASISSQVNVLCFGASTGSLSVQASGGTIGSGYSYLWKNSNNVTVSNSASAVGLPAGAYTCLITDTKGCTTLVSGTILQPQAPVTVLTSGSNNVSCFGGNNGKVWLQPTGGVAPYTYLWSNQSTNDTIANLTAGNYSVTVTDNNGCTASQSFTVTQPTLLTNTFTKSVFFGNTNISCPNGADGTIDLTPSGGTAPYTYLWSNSATTQDLNGLAAGTYTCTITDAKGCTSQAVVSMSDPNDHVWTSSVTDVSCNGDQNGAISMNITGGNAPYRVNWNSSANSSGQTEVTFRVDMSQTQVSSLGVGAVIQGSIGVLGLSNLYGDSVYIGNRKFNPGDTIYWRYFNGSNAETVPISCGAITSLSVFERYLVVPDHDTILPVICFSSCTNCSGVSEQGFDGTIQTTTKAINKLGAGTYNFSLVDRNGCISTNSVIVNQPSAFNAVSTGITNPTCPQNLDGAITIQSTGGTLPYSYLWSNGATSSSVSGLAKGNYWAKVTDTKGCRDSLYFTLTAPEPFDFEDICVLSVDSATGKNLVVWNKTPGQRTLEYRILKENAQGQFVQIGNQPYLNLSVFTDQSSNPQTQPDRYKIALLDSCGNSSDTSDFHRTIHLQSNLGSSGEVNLSWTPYLGKPVQSYEIWRWITSGNLVQIATVAASVNSYTDLNPPVASNVYYVVNAVFPSSCSPIAGKNTAFDISKSNILNQTGIGFNENQALRNMRVYPNPNGGVFTVEFSNIDDIQSVSIIDGVGRVIRHIKTVDNTKILLDLRNEPKGVYRINATYSNGQANVPIVVH